MIRPLTDDDIGRRVVEYPDCPCPYCTKTYGRLASYDNEAKTLTYVRDPLGSLDNWKKFSAYTAKYEWTFFEDNLYE